MAAEVASYLPLRIDLLSINRQFEGLAFIIAVMPREMGGGKRYVSFCKGSTTEEAPRKTGDVYCN